MMQGDMQAGERIYAERSILWGLGVPAGRVRARAGRAGDHGWRWTEDGNFELTGVITAARLGNPHGILEVDAEGEAWIVEVGQPWRNAARRPDRRHAGGRASRSWPRAAARPTIRRTAMKAERVTIDGVLYELYPERD